MCAGLACWLRAPVFGVRGCRLLEIGGWFDMRLCGGILVRDKKHLLWGLNADPMRFKLMK